MRAYASLFSIPGSTGFALAGLIGRLPVAMLSLAIVLALSATGSSYASAGGVAASTMLAFTLGAPLTSRWADRRGQFVVLLVLAVVHGAGLLALMVAIHVQASVWLLCMAGAVVGASRPATGSMVRARWAQAIRQHSDRMVGLESALTLESIADELAFILGPALIALLSVQGQPLLGLGCCLFLSVGGAVALAVQRKTEPLVQWQQGVAGRPFAAKGLLVLSTSASFIGAALGSVEIISLAHASLLGAKAVGGLLVAALAAGGALGGIVYGSRTWKVPLRQRLIGCLTLVAAALTPLAVINDLRLLALLLFVAGLTIVPASVASVALIEGLVPPARLTEGITWLTTASALGMAAGAWIAGWLVDVQGSQRAYIFPAACSVVALGIVVAFTRWLGSDGFTKAPARRRSSDAAKS